MFDDPAQRLHRRRLHIGDERHEVRIAHGNGRAADFHLFSLEKHLDFLVPAFRPGPVHGDALCIRDGFSHIHRRFPDFSVHDLHPDLLDPGQGFQGDLRFVRQTLVIDIFGDAARPVAAHLPLGRIRVEHAHPEVRHFGRTDADQPVRAHGQVAGTHIFRDLPGVGEHFFHAVHIYVIIAAAMHFGKSQLHSSFLPMEQQNGRAELLVPYSTVYPRRGQQRSRPIRFRRSSTLRGWILYTILQDVSFLPFSVQKI